MTDIIRGHETDPSLRQPTPRPEQVYTDPLEVQNRALSEAAELSAELRASIPGRLQAILKELGALRQEIESIPGLRGPHGDFPLPGAVVQLGLAERSLTYTIQTLEYGDKLFPSTKPTDEPR